MSSSSANNKGRGEDPDRTFALLDALELSVPPADVDDIYCMNYQAYVRHVKCQSLYYGRSLVVHEGSRPDACVVACRRPDCPFVRHTKELASSWEEEEEPGARERDHVQDDDDDDNNNSNDHVDCRRRLQVVTKWHQHSCGLGDHLDHALVEDDDGSAFLADVLVKLVALEERRRRASKEQEGRGRASKQGRGGHRGRKAAPQGGEEEEARDDGWSLEACTRLMKRYWIDCSSAERQRELDAARLVALERQHPRGSAPEGGDDNDRVAIADSDRSLELGLGARESGENERDLKSPPCDAPLLEGPEESDPSVGAEPASAAAASPFATASPAPEARAARAPEAQASSLAAFAATFATCYDYAKAAPTILFANAASTLMGSPPVQEGLGAIDERRIYLPYHGAAEAAEEGNDSNEEDDDDDDDDVAAMDLTVDDEDTGSLKPRAVETSLVVGVTNTDPLSEDGLADSASDAALRISLRPTGPGGSQDKEAASRGTLALADAEIDSDAQRAPPPKTRTARVKGRLRQALHAAAKTGTKTKLKKGPPPKKVQQLHPETGRVITTFESNKKAALQIGASESQLGNAIRKNSTYKGFRWRWCPQPEVPLPSSEQSSISTAKTRKLHKAKDPGAKDAATRISKNPAKQVAAEEGSSQSGATLNGNDGRAAASLTVTTSTQPRRTKRACYAPKPTYVPAWSFRTIDPINRSTDHSTSKAQGSEATEQVRLSVERSLSDGGNSSSSTKNRRRSDARSGTPLSPTRARQTRSNIVSEALPYRAAAREKARPNTSRDRKRSNGKVERAVKSKRSSTPDARKKRPKAASSETENAGPVVGAVPVAGALLAAAEEILEEPKPEHRFATALTKGFRVVYEDRTMRSIGSGLTEALRVVHETGPLYEAGRGPISSSTYSTYPFMFKPTLESLKQKYEKLVAQDLCLPTRFNTSSVEQFLQSIDTKLEGLAAFELPEESDADVKAEAKECRLSRQQCARWEEAERLARHHEDAAYKEQQLLENSQRRRRASPPQSFPVLFESTTPICEMEDCTLKGCPICEGEERVVPFAGEKPREMIPMPLYCHVELIEVIGSGRTARGVDAAMLRKARLSISMLREIRSAVPFVTNFPENPLIKLRREVEGGRYV